MIKARAGNTLILGLSRMNIERLQEGKPISFDGGELRLDGLRFIIMAGETEQSIMDEIKAAQRGTQ